MSTKKLDVIPYGKNTKSIVVDNWGSIHDEGASRRAFVSNYPDDTKLEELKNFFGLETLEGIKRFKKFRNSYALVQFKRPSHYTNALEKNKSEFRRRSISIVPYREMPKKPIKKPPRRSTSRERWIEGNDHRLNQARSRSLNRSRSSSHERSRSSSRERSRTPTRQTELLTKGPNTDPINSGLFHFNQQYNPLQLQALPNFSQPVINQNSYFQFNQPNFAQTGLSQTTNLAFQHPSMWTRNLPGDIDLTLKLILQQGTARNLSLIHIQNVINYLETEKRFIQINARLDVPTIQQAPVQEKPSTSEIVSMQQRRDSSSPIRPPTAASPQDDSKVHDEDTEKMSQDGSESDDGSLMEKLSENIRGMKKKV